MSTGARVVGPAASGVSGHATAVVTGSAGAAGPDPRVNPFPGLRPFEQHESALFFGRDEQCDELLARLARRRFVAVVGMSGSGKSSLVRAGVLPALDRGYIPAAGSSWQVAVFRPGSDPLANLTRALSARRRPVDDGEATPDRSDDVGRVLHSSSLGLVGAARLLLTDPGDSLLVLADQFEEIFRFRHIAPGRRAREDAAACVDLLVNAAQQDEVPIYVMLTMRSDYLGDCAHFTGLPEALNDSQFLVPRMTRAQLRAAIECPVAVGGGRISARLVQRLLHDADRLAEGDDEPAAGAQQDRDQLPVLQHALMRLWEVSRAERERGEPIDLRHYEQPPVETLRHAIDHHAEEVYGALPSDRHRDIARQIFQQLTDRDAENREVRRPTPLAELTAVALRRASDAVTPDESAIVHEVLGAFSAEGRAFAVVNAQQDVDISHESFIRKWRRLRDWLDEENRSRRVYGKLADAASSWERGEASLYRGPELTEARRWWQRASPTALWADRYGGRFASAEQFLARSVRMRRLRLGLLAANAVLLVVAAVAIVVLMIVSRNEALRAEAAALEARNATDSANQLLAEANKLRAAALEAQRQGETGRAELLAQQARRAEQQAAAAPTQTPSEVEELKRLRLEVAAVQEREKKLLADNALRQKTDAENRTVQDQLRTQQTTDVADRAIRAEQEVGRLQKQMAALQGANDGLMKERDALQKELAGLRAQMATLGDRPQIERLLRDYEAAYAQLDAAAVNRLVPSLALADLEKSFSQLRGYKVEIANPQISVAGDQAVVKGVRRITAAPRVGTPPSPQVVPTTFVLRRVNGTWTIVAVESQ
jgi:hypothetical protein